MGRFIFSRLPAELRIQIYNEILYSIPSPMLSPITLDRYRGLILSCKTIKNEFENEWAKIYNASIARVLLTWPPSTRLRALPISRLAQRVDILYSGELEHVKDIWHNNAAICILFVLIEVVKSFSFHPDAEYGFVPLGPTGKGLLQSQPWFWLCSLRYAIKRIARMRGIPFQGVSVTYPNMIPEPAFKLSLSISARRAGSRSIIIKSAYFCKPGPWDWFQQHWRLFRTKGQFPS